MYVEYEDGDEYDNEMEVDEESIRRNALTAVEARLSAAQSKRTKIDDMLDKLTGSSSASATSDTKVIASENDVSGGSSIDIESTSTAIDPETLLNVTTTLASDLGDFPKSTVGHSLRLVSLVISGAAGHLQSIPPPVEVYSDLAMANLSKLIKQTISFLPQKSYKFSHVSVLSSCLELKLVLRMVLAMSSRDLDQHRAYLEFLSNKNNAGGGMLTRQTVQSVSLLRSRGHHKSLLSHFKGGDQLHDAVRFIVPKVVLLPR